MLFFPAPLGPTSAVTEPTGISNEQSLSANFALYDFCKLVVLTTFDIGVGYMFLDFELDSNTSLTAFSKSEMTVLD